MSGCRGRDLCSRDLIALVAWTADTAGMSKDAPDHHDAHLVIKLYDLRREPVMRESRDALNAEYWPKNADEAVAVLSPDHPMNRAYRQVSTYWEMVYGMAKNGIVHTDYLLENTGEGMFLFAKVEPYLEAIRAAAHSSDAKRYSRRCGGRMCRSRSSKQRRSSRAASMR